MIAKDVKLEQGVVIRHPDLVNLYGCVIGTGTKIGPFVEVQKGVRVGKNCKISSHAFICEGVDIADGVFVGHGVMFINDIYPAAIADDGELQTEADWEVVPTTVRKGAAIGSNATIMGGVTIGEGALIGAGAVLTHDAPDFSVMAGSPARVIGDTREKRGHR